MDNKILMPLNYKTQAEDTTKEAELIQFSLWRRLNLLQKTVLFRRTYRRMSNLIFINLKQQFNKASEELIREKYLEKKLGKTWLKRLSNNYSGGLMIEDPLWLAYKLNRIFNTLKIKYYVGGSVASSLHGEIRYTEDLDIVIYLETDQVELLIKTLQNEFYISETAVNEALRGEISSFNIIHLQTTEKADLFIGGNDDFSLSKKERCQRITINDNSEESFYICSPEDIILQKLIWYKMTAKESQKQWRDILGVLKLQGDKLDFHYLWYWGDQLGLLTELDQAFSESGLV
jgi:hypothetical protein